MDSSIADDNCFSRIIQLAKDDGDIPDAIADAPSRLAQIATSAVREFIPR